MNRRSFVRNLVAALVLSPVVARFAEALPCAAPVRIALNPAYESAEYEEVIEWLPGSGMSEWDKAEMEAGMLGLFPPRFNIVDGKKVRVNPF